MKTLVVGRLYEALIDIPAWSNNNTSEAVYPAIPRPECIAKGSYVVYLGETAKSRFVHILLAPNGLVMKTGAQWHAQWHGELKELGE